VQRFMSYHVGREKNLAITLKAVLFSA